MRVQNITSSIVEKDPLLLLKKYERQIKELKQELNMHDALVERSSGVVYTTIIPPRRNIRPHENGHGAAIHEMEDEALQFESLHQIREMFRQFIQNPVSKRRRKHGGEATAAAAAYTGFLLVPTALRLAPI